MEAMQAQLLALNNRLVAPQVPVVPLVPDPILDAPPAAQPVAATALTQTQMAVTRASIASLVVYDAIPQDLDAWIDSFEAVADQGELSDQERVRLATSKFGPMLLT